tara:strand:+ start:336 stop:761 length:426 start_codon:yes stop_codon:yes gene_type:complete
MSYKKQDKMKITLLLLSLLISTQLFSQQWISDSDFESKVSQKSPYGDDDVTITVVEFWVEFNKDNAFKEWESLKGVTYFRCDVATSPKSKKEYRIRMAPTLLIFVDGVLEESIKSGLDLILPKNLSEIQEEVDELLEGSKF